jgi:hypothetical protein
MNNMGREIMAALKRFQVGSDGDGVTVGGALVVSGATTANTFSATALNATGTVTFSGSVILSGTTTANTFSTDLITEKTSAAGVTIDGVLLKDGGASVSTLNTSGQVVFNDAGADVDFRVEGDADANLLFVDASADRVGIGTSSPSRRLTTQFDSATTYSSSEFSSTSNSLYLRNANTTTNAFTGIEFLVGTNGEAAISATRTGDGESALTFGTRGGGSRTERVRVDSGGNLLVGRTAYVGLTTDGLYFGKSFNHWSLTSEATYVNRNGTDGSVFIFSKAAGGVGSISVTASATTYNTSSDYRLKENIAPMTGALEKIAQLKPCTYTWKVNGSAGQGFIAHELQEVVPDCVTGEKDAVETYTDEEGVEQTRPVYQGIDTSFLVATLTAAIQELKAELDTVKAELATLKGN